MYKLELKRLLKTRSTWILMAAALLITLILCCVNIFNPYYYAYDGESLHGLAATEMRRIVTQSSEGEWTPERIRDVFAQLAEADANYGVAKPTTALRCSQAMTPTLRRSRATPAPSCAASRRCSTCST